MKTTPMFKKAALLGSVGAALVATSVQAQFTAPKGNLLWGAYDLNAGAVGAFNIVVDLGSHARFNSPSTQAILLGGSSSSEAYQGQSAISENRFTHANVLATFGQVGGLDNIFSSVFGINTTFSPTAFAANFLTRARIDQNVKSADYQRFSGTAQGGTGGLMETVRNGAVDSGIDFAGNTSTAQDTTVSSSYPAQSPFTTGSYPNQEASTGDNFNSIVRMDLYSLLPKTTPGTQPGGPADYLGYFEYQADGDLWFVPENFVPVPEASTYGLVAGAGLLFMALRRQMSNKTA